MSRPRCRSSAGRDSGRPRLVRQVRRRRRSGLGLRVRDTCRMRWATVVPVHVARDARSGSVGRPMLRAVVERIVEVSGTSIRWHAEASRERAPEPPAQRRRSAHPGHVQGETSRTASGHHHGRLLAAPAEHRAVDGTGRPGPMLRRRTCAAICQPARRRAPGPTARPTWSPPHPEQGWSLLCNGVALFDDNGELLPDGRPLAPQRVETVMSGSGAPR